MQSVTVKVEDPRGGSVEIVATVPHGWVAHRWSDVMFVPGGTETKPPHDGLVEFATAAMVHPSLEHVIRDFKRKEGSDGGMVTVLEEGGSDSEGVRYCSVKTTYPNGSMEHPHLAAVALLKKGGMSYCLSTRAHAPVSYTDFSTLVRACRSADLKTPIATSNDLSDLDFAFND